jgi:hypothetical protein
MTAEATKARVTPHLKTAGGADHHFSAFNPIAIPGYSPFQSIRQAVLPNDFHRRFPKVKNEHDEKPVAYLIKTSWQSVKKASVQQLIFPPSDASPSAD